MTQRYNSILIVLDKDIREDDIKPLVNVLRQLRGVKDVIPEQNRDVIGYVNAWQDLVQKIHDMLEKDRTETVKNIFSF